MTQLLRAVRVNELTDLRAIAMPLLFLVHSNFQISMPTLELQVSSWFLSSMFFVSGYLTFLSFNSRGQETKKFLTRRFSSIYLPFVIIMGFYLLTDYKWLGYSWQGFLSHSSVGLAFFAFFGEGVYLMRQFWFVPTLLVFIVLFILLDKYVKSRFGWILIISALFAFNLVNWSFNSDFRFNWNFGYQFLVFASGYFIAKRNLLEKLRKPRTLLVLLAIALTILYVDFVLVPNWDYLSVLGRTAVFSYNWITGTALALSTILPLLALLFYLRQKFPRSKVYLLTGLVSSCSLFIYLWESYVSPRICALVFGTQFYFDLTGYNMFSSILVRFAAVLIVAFITLKLQKVVANFIRKRWDFWMKTQ